MTPQCVESTVLPVISSNYSSNYQVQYSDNIFFRICAADYILVFSLHILISASQTFERETRKSYLLSFGKICISRRHLDVLQISDCHQNNKQNLVLLCARTDTGKLSYEILPKGTKYRMLHIYYAMKLNVPQL